MVRLGNYSPCSFDHLSLPPPDLTVVSLFNRRYQHTSVPFIWASGGLLNLLVGSEGCYQPFLSAGHYFSEPVGGALVEPPHDEGEEYQPVT